MIELTEKVDEKVYKRVGSGLSEYERNKQANTPTHFSKTLIKEGRYKGFDEIVYYTKKNL
tara:strand:+ start:317 stop:496 length:180 start_codon:yes stop_codon:yes gene_type:complete